MILLYSSIVWLAVCVDGAESLITVSAAVGSTAVLPCKLTKEFTNKSTIRWKVHNKLVLERSNNGMSEGPGFEGRVDVPVDELQKGNCSLVLKDVRISDDDFYKPFSMEHAEETGEIKATEISRVQLSVAALQISAREGSTVLLPCKCSHLPVQTPRVQWRFHRETVFERKSKESFQGEGYEDRVDVPEDELLKGNCSLVLKNFSVSDAGIYRSSILVEETKELVLVQKIELSVNTSGWILDSSEKKTKSSSEHWDSQPEGNRTSWIIWTGVISVLIIIIIIIISVFVIYRRREGILTASPCCHQATDSIKMDLQLHMRKISTQQRNTTTSDSDNVLRSGRLRTTESMSNIRSRHSESSAST